MLVLKLMQKEKMCEKSLKQLRNVNMRVGVHVHDEKVKKEFNNVVEAINKINYDGKSFECLKRHTQQMNQICLSLHVQINNNSM